VYSFGYRNIINEAERRFTEICTRRPNI